MAHKKEIDCLNVWSSSHVDAKIDTLTPHKVAVMFLIGEYIMLLKAADPDICESPKSRRQFCMLLLKLIQFPDMSYVELHNLLTSESYAIQQEHMEGFEKLMKILSTRGVEVLFLMSGNAAVTCGISPFGIVGLYIRRVNITLNRMSFSELMTLTKSTVAYYQRGVRQIEGNSINSGIVDNSFAYTEKTGTQHRWSIRQAELFVVQQCALIQKNERQAMPPKDLQALLNEIIRDNPLYSQAYFLTYMNSLRVNDYLNAIESIHRAFDRNAVKTHSPPETRGFQYSSLNLAILHAHFKHTGEALACLRECIMLAQEAGDRHCLQLAQAWLWYLDKDRVQLNEKSVSNNSDASYIHAVSLDTQFVVKVATLAGFKPAKLFELLLKSDTINCQHSLMDLTANSVAQRAAAWTLYGKYELASISAQLLLTGNLTSLGRMYNGEGVCHALCTVAMKLGAQGEFVLSTVVLQHAKRLFPRQPCCRHWMIVNSFVASEQAIWCGSWTEAAEACNQLKVLDATTSTLQRAKMLIAQMDTKGAQTLVEPLLNHPGDAVDALSCVRATILMAASLILERATPYVIELLQRASTVARQHFFEYERAIVDAYFAQALLMMDMPQKALQTINGRPLETVLANGGVYDRSRMHFLFIRCVTAAATTREEKCIRIVKCTSIVEEVIDGFAKIKAHAKVRDVFMFMATLCNAVGMVEERNRYASQFRQAIEQNVNERYSKNICF